MRNRCPTRAGEIETAGQVIAILFCIVAAIALLFGAIGGCCYIQPRYNVYEQEKEGEAQLAKAESTRRVLVLEAQARKDSATMLADAEVIRASGVAKANQIIGDSLKGNEGYLKYLWIQNLNDNGRGHEVIYVPTEANLPILEAGHRAVQAEAGR